MRNFENWETQDLEIEFGLFQNFNSTLLNNWLSSTTTFDDSIKQRLDKLSRKYFEFADYWNEDELKMQGISPILDIVDYSSKYYTVFSQRPLSATINGIEIGGRVDFMIAKGRQKPIQPYFFIHEYKQETKRGSGDPKGQLLSELLAAQHRNNVEFPIYGCYVIGQNWYFLVLENKNYTIASPFATTNKEVFDVFKVLKAMKTIIEERLQ